MLNRSNPFHRVVIAAFFVAVMKTTAFSQTWTVVQGPKPGSGKAKSETSGGSSDNSALKETLVNMEKKSWIAWKDRDGKFFQEFLSDDHVELGFGGPTDKATVVKFVASPVCVVNSYTVDRFQLTVLDANTALLVYHAAQDTTCGGNKVPSPVWVSSLYIKRGDRWWNAAYQQTQTRD